MLYRQTDRQTDEQTDQQTEPEQPKTLEELKEYFYNELDNRQENNIIEPENASFLKRFIAQADSIDDVYKIAALGTMYKKTGFHFDVRLEKDTNKIKYLSKNENLSFKSDIDSPNKNIKNQLIIGDNYDALKNLLINYRNQIDVIYIDPPYGKDDMGQFAETNYNNAITRDNLLSMLYPRLQMAKQLLSEDGVIFCSIDDKNQAYVKCLFDDVFGDENFIFNIPRLNKKGGKSTNTIQKNHDYILCYCKNSQDTVFSQLLKEESSYNCSDEYEKERGKYKLSQTLDYNSLQYSSNMDYEIVIGDNKYYPGGSYENFIQRHLGNHGKIDWVWRWSQKSIDWGIKNGFIVVKGDRLYTKTYLKCRKKQGCNEIEYLEGTKPYTTLYYIDNLFSNDNGKKNLDLIFENSSVLFRNPKPINLIKSLVKMVNLSPNAIILDFFAGSGTTGQAVLELNKEDGGQRSFILCTNNEKTEMNPTGIAYDVTSKRLKRVMTGECYDGSNDFKWIQDNEALGGDLEVVDISECDDVVDFNEMSPFELIDETLYGLDKFENIADKIKWVCENFKFTMKSLDEEHSSNSKENE